MLQLTILDFTFGQASLTICMSNHCAISSLIQFFSGVFNISPKLGGYTRPTRAFGEVTTQRTEKLHFKDFRQKESFAKKTFYFSKL
jgi:hypothetical protein